jgi:hypothetical protein
MWTWDEQPISPVNKSAVKANRSEGKKAMQKTDLVRMVNSRVLAKLAINDVQYRKKGEEVSSNER